MTIRILLLILFYSSVFVSESNGQKLVEELSVFIDYDYKLNGSIKHLSTRKSYRLDEKLKFNLSLLNYYQKSAFSRTEFSFDNRGNITHHEYSATKLNTDEIVKGKSTYKWKYNNELLIYRALSVTSNYQGLDTSFQTKLVYSFDDKDRVIEIKQEYSPGVESKIEEIEYFEGGRKSTLFDIKDTIKTKTCEDIYDLNDNLIIQKMRISRNNNYNLTEHYYNKDGRLESTVNSKFYLGKNLFSGAYIIYYYNKDDALKKIKRYKLRGDNVDGIDEYWKGDIEYTTWYKEKRKGAYIFQKKKSKNKGEPSKINSRIILDENRNIIARYHAPYLHSDGNIRTGDLTIYNITYY